MHFYKAAFDHVPVSWLVALFNIGCGIYNIIEYGVERVWSFGSAICNNLVGFDRYFIFLNNSCVPIPYHFYGGSRGEGAWLYDSRNRVFQSCTGETLKRQVLPWLTMDLECTIKGERCEYNLSDWMESVTFYAPNGEFPHPLQLLAAWSLNSHVWPSLQHEANTQLKIIRAHDGEDMSLHMYKDFSQFAWCETTFEDNEGGSDSEHAQSPNAFGGVGAEDSSERSESPHEDSDSEEVEASDAEAGDETEEVAEEEQETLSLSASSSEQDIHRSEGIEETKEDIHERPVLPLSDDESSDSSLVDASRDMEAVD